MSESQAKRKATAENHLGFWSYHLSEPCFVYVIQGDPGSPIKVGKARDVTRRLKELQTGNPQKLRVLYVVPGGSDVESHFHRRLKLNCVQGEWFAGKLVEPFLDYIADLAERMVAAYAHDGKAPHIFDVDGVRFGKVRKAPQDNPVTVRFVEPDPVMDPTEAAEIREGLVGCSRAVIAGPADSLTYKRITVSPHYN